MLDTMSKFSFLNAARFLYDGGKPFEVNPNFKPLSANPTKWPSTIKKYVRSFHDSLAKRNEFFCFHINYIIFIRFAYFKILYCISKIFERTQKNGYCLILKQYRV